MYYVYKYACDRYKTINTCKSDKYKHVQYKDVIISNTSINSTSLVGRRSYCYSMRAFSVH